MDEVNKGVASKEFTLYNEKNGCLDLNNLSLYKDPRYIHLNEDLDEEFTLSDFYEENSIPYIFDSQIKLQFYASPIIDLNYDHMWERLMYEEVGFDDNFLVG